MRTDQYMGLNERAFGLVKELDRKVCGYFEGAFGNRFELFTYHRPDGSLIYSEYIQVEPWSSGPMFFIALKNSSEETVKESLWTGEEIGQLETGK